MGCTSKMAVILLLAHLGVGIRRKRTVVQESPYYVDEGEECNGSLAPAHATLCKDGFECATSGLPGAGGTCKKLATLAESKALKTKGPYYADEGEECNGSLAPEHATLCKDGFECATSGLPGAGGTCKKIATLAKSSALKTKGPYYADEGEECNGSLAPEHATLCKDGFECATSGLPGAGGTCKKLATLAESKALKTKGPYYADEGEECNGSLAPEHATLCKDGFECATSGLPGAGGTCKKIATLAKSSALKTKGPYYADEGEECNGSLAPEHAALCKDGF
eukprot:TRINITY_DN6662_c0_g1_i6.p1 TRINITY_DN6662_c0_g1~~TRINITY_DN6662_c0_g1_i6.p1  ORF type:complete len:290 (+),score=42.03 TRINITY_DN6662_c0_g1_i6:29-871(+)